MMTALEALGALSPNHLENHAETEQDSSPIQRMNMSI